MITQQQIDACVAVAREYGATRLLLFGSARDNPSRARDIDLICDGVEGMRFFEMAGLMEHAAHAPVDVVSAVPKTPFIELNAAGSKVLYG